MAVTAAVPPVTDKVNYTLVQLVQHDIVPEMVGLKGKQDLVVVGGLKCTYLIRPLQKMTESTSRRAAKV